MKRLWTFPSFVVMFSCAPAAAQSTAPPSAPSAHAIVLHAARLLDVESGHLATPGEILVYGQAIAEVGAASVKDMGKVVGALKAKYPGQMDFAKASAIVKGLLSA